MLPAIRLAAFAVLVLSLLSAVVDVSARATNAERLARGLGPARPRRLYSGTRTNAARAVPSGSPGTTQRGVIKLVARSSGTILGYMTTGGATANVAGADTYSYSMPSPATALVTFNDDSNPSYHLSAFASSAATLGTGRSTSVKLMGILTGTTPAGATPTFAEGYGYVGGYAETTIFSVDPSDGKITVHWVNPDGSSVVPSTYLSQTTVYATGDFAAFTATGGASAYTQVDLYYDTITVTVY